MLKQLGLSWLVWVWPLQAAFEIQTVAPQQMALGGITALPVFGFNPAGISLASPGWFASGNFTNLYGLKQLPSREMHIGYSHKVHQTAALRVLSTGKESYQENTYTVASARRISSIGWVGLGISYFDLHVANYSNDHALGLTAGAIFLVDTTLQVSFVWQNLNNPRLTRSRENLPQCFTTGIGWQAHPSVHLYGELFKDTQFPFMTRLGIAVKALKVITLMGGGQLNPDRLTGGVAVNIGLLHIALALQQHQTLPYTLYWGCGIRF